MKPECREIILPPGDLSALEGGIRAGDVCRVYDGRSLTASHIVERVTAEGRPVLGKNLVGAV